MSKVYRHSNGTYNDYPEVPVTTLELRKEHQISFVEEKKEDLNKGIRYNKGKLRWRNFPMFLMEPLVKVGSANEKHEGNPNGKYDTLNFLKGLKVTETLDSLHRHLRDFSDPSEPDIDPEDDVHHLAKIAWNALVALYYIENKPEFDDRTLKYEKKDKK